ncbi:Fic family protein [Testudinibacter aquarius]|uniref:Protein adenylyltransferase n=1 Tax=Testudinibacter aquarius TaxID=1524974 RepID=A0A4R3XZ86_9PAST|nr:Fic family protein [Testudinibacter aquarius]TNG88252.1 Fic family protein [Pasteurellaceae bacterium USgator41]TNG94385.1 Fic family protein [Pasteurellaceae bacterium UScroc12]TNG96255.1 Fic family protein [Pasteurellaceae bacterium UScroc31]TNH00354.1 Fic family protein [Pasteurellaceae bacterium USgator11]KAE9528288.1 cell filamentation protein Fic [Testudinibacter aquarius]
MKFETFKAGEWQQQYQYKSFLPVTVNREWIWEDSQINTLLERASRTLAELDAFTLIVPDVDLFIQMHITKEANNSSRIEGTQTHIDEAVLDSSQLAPEKRDDWQEVQNYIQAINDAIDELQRLPLSNRLLKQTHAILMQGVRGEHKTPGEFRTSQNWIGGSNLTNAVFIPPHPNEVPILMSDLELFWHNDQINVPDLIRIAISHYHFETIHPFLDGNGRIGRLLIALYLVGKGLLRKPSLYLSDFFERNRASYYDALMRVRISNDMTHWVKFFLSAVIETASKGKQTFENILALRREIDQRAFAYGKRAENVQLLLRHLYRRPAITVTQASKLIKSSHQTASSLLNKMAEDGILQEITGYQRNRVFMFSRYLDLFET